MSGISRSKSESLCEHPINCWWRCKQALFANMLILFSLRLAPREWCPVRQYDQDRDSHWYSVSMQFIWRACIHISSGNQHLIHNCVGGMFTVDTSQALPSGCKLGPRRIQMDHFPLASQTHNSVEWELLLYSWEEQMPGSIFLAILRFASSVRSSLCTSVTAVCH